MVSERGRDKVKIKKKSNFPNLKVISHTTHPLSCPFPSNSDSLSCFPPAELLSACHELRCRYGCVMTRNGTFCFCADGFEVGEDGTSCRGRIQLRKWQQRGVGAGLLPWSTPPHVSLCPQPDSHQMNKQEVPRVREPSVCRQGLMYST